MPPLTLLIKPASGRCNMRCRYCFYVDEVKYRAEPCGDIMNADTQEALIRRAFIFARGEISFVFQGGEPTLAGLAYFRRFINLVRSYNTCGLTVHYGIQTNGYDLSDEWIAFLKENGFLVGLSLDGDREAHDLFRLDARGEGTFQCVSDTLERLRKAKVDTNVLCVITEPLARRPREIWAALAPYRYLQFIPCLEFFDGKPKEWTLTAQSYGRFLIETFDCYHKAFLKNRYVSVRLFDNWVQMVLGFPPESCAMQGRCSCNFTVESDGSVYPCDFYALDEWNLGNIRETSLMRMGKSRLAEAFISGSLAVPEPCERCPWHALCRNGCRRERDRQGLNRFCEAYRMFFAARETALKDMAQKVRSKLL
jgi:uncharacterized protein